MPLLSRIYWAVCLTLAAVRPSPGQEDAYRVPEVVVTASRLPSLPYPGLVVVVEGAELEARGNASLADVLGRLPGVDARARGVPGVQTDLEILGATFSQVLVLVDGIRVSDPQTAHHNLNLPLSAGDLERVEVLYGAASSVHGPDAFGGVVNLVPRRRSGAAVSAAGNWGPSLDAGGSGSFGSDAALRWGVAGERAGLWVSAGQRRSDGYRDGTDYHEERLYGRATAALGGGRLTLSSGLQHKDFGARDFYAPYPSREFTRVWLHTAAYTRNLGGGSLSVRTHHRRHRDRFVLVADDPELYQNRHLSRRTGLEVHAVVANGLPGQLALGGELTRESLVSSNLGDRVRDRGAGFGEYGVGRGAWSARLALRLDHHEGFGWEGSPSLSLGRQLPRGRVYVTASRVHRAPSFTELYYRDPANQGNAHLRAESAEALELGAHLRLLPSWEARASAFARRESDLIDYVRPRGEAVWQARNLGRMRITGALVQLSGTWLGLRQELAYAWTDKERRLTGDLESKYVFTHPRHQVTAGLTHPAGGGVKARWRVVAKERATLGDYATVELALGRELGAGRATVRLSNLANARYEAVRGVPAPGRWVTLETSLDL